MLINYIKCIHLSVSTSNRQRHSINCIINAQDPQRSQLYNNRYRSPSLGSNCVYLALLQYILSHITCTQHRLYDYWSSLRVLWVLVTGNGNNAIKQIGTNLHFQFTKKNANIIVAKPRPPSTSLRQLRAVPADPADCAWFNRSNPDIVDAFKRNFICARSVTTIRDAYVGTNKGDSGGPLVCLKDGRWRLYGIVSLFGMNGASSYARVGNVLEWIRNNTGGQHNRRI